MDSMDSQDWRNVSSSNESAYTNFSVNTTITGTMVHNPLDLHNQLKLVFERYGVSVVAILGIVLNSLSIIVFLQHRMRSISINILLLGLQISDLLVVITLLYMAGLHRLLTFWGYGDPQIMSTVFLYVVALNLMGKAASHYFTVLVSVERYIAVCHPLKVQVHCSQHRAIVASKVVAVFSLLFTLPSFLRLHWPNWFRVQIVVIIFIPFVILLCFNIAIYIGYRKSQKSTEWLRSTGSHDRNDRDKSFTLLLFSIVMVYLFCNSFYVVEYLCLLLGVYDIWVIRIFVRPFTAFLITVNSACNFVFYCAYGKKFRGELGKLFWIRGTGKTLPDRQTDIISSTKSNPSGSR